MYRSKAQRGIGKLTILIFGAIIVVVGFCAYQILPFYYYFYELKSHMEQVIKVASTDTDAEIRKKLLYHITKFEIPANPEDLRIERDGRHMRISLPYEEVFYITWEGKDYDLHTFKFHAYAEGNF